jgi:hypothetical protein
MATSKVEDRRIDQFFSGPGARADEWRGLVEASKAWSSESGDRAGFEEKLSQLSTTEEYHAYPCFAAYDAAGCEYVRLNDPEIEPGQVITQEMIDFMRKLDVKEIHGYNNVQGLKLVRPEALARFGDRRPLASSFRPAAE